MRRHLPPLNSVRAFEAAARHLSISAAADELCVSRGAISQQVTSLEERLGVRLMERTTRKITLTEAGEQLYASAKRSFDDLSRVTDSILKTQRKPNLQVSVSTYFSARWLSPRLGRFWEQFPDFQLWFHHVSDSDAVNPDEADLAIRWGYGDWPDVESVEKLFDAPMSLYCSPKLFAGIDRLPQMGDLEGVVLLSDKIEPWRNWFEQAGVSDPDLSNSRYIADPMFRVQTAVDGYGVLLGDCLLQHELSTGDLIQPFAAQVTDCGFYVLTRDQRFISSETRVFRDWLLDEARVAAAAE